LVWSHVLVLPLPVAEADHRRDLGEDGVQRADGEQRVEAHVGTLGRQDGVEAGPQRGERQRTERLGRQLGRRRARGAGGLLRDIRLVFEVALVTAVGILAGDGGLLARHARGLGPAQRIDGAAEHVVGIHRGVGSLVSHGNGSLAEGGRGT